MIDWGRRSRRPGRLGKNLTRFEDRGERQAEGSIARPPLQHLAAVDPGLLLGPQATALRQVIVQNYY